MLEYVWASYDSAPGVKSTTLSHTTKNMQKDEITMLDVPSIQSFVNNQQKAVQHVYNYL